jgi:predicted Zn-dependent protease
VKKPNALFPAFLQSEVDEGSVAGTLELEPGAFRFSWDGGSISFLPNIVTLERDPSGLIVLSDSTQPGRVVSTKHEEILGHWVIERNNRLRLQARDILRKREGRRTLVLAGAFLGIFCASAFALLLLAGITVRFLVNQVPVSRETSLGDMAFQQITQEVVFVNQPRATHDLHLLVQRLARKPPATDYEYEIRIVQMEEPNAFALPGGRLLVTTGLIEWAERPEQIAGVLAHELAHVTQRHGLRTIVHTAGPYYALGIFITDRQRFLSFLRDASTVALALGYSREQETEADLVGWQYLVDAGIDPRGMIEFLEHLAGDPFISSMEGAVPAFLSTHPPTTERIERLRKLWDDLERKNGFVDLERQLNEAPYPAE